MSAGQVIDLSEQQQRDARRHDPSARRPKWQRKLARKARKELPVELALKRHKQQHARLKRREQKPSRTTCREKVGTRRGKQYRSGKHRTRAKLAQLADAA